MNDKAIQIVSHPQPISPQDRALRLPPRRPTMLELLKKFPLPPNEAWLGWCDDGFPMGFSLNKTTDFAPIIYFVEDDEAGFRFLNTLAGALAWYSEPRHVQFVFISRRPHTAWWFRHNRNPEHQDQTPEGREFLVDYKQPVDHIYAYYQPGTGFDSEIICHLAGVLEQRTFGRFLDGGWVLFLEDLPTVWERLEENAKAELPYFLAKGYQWKMQTVAWIRWEDVKSGRVPHHILDLFGVRCYGAAYRWKPNVPRADLLHMLFPDEAIVRADGGKYLKFWTPAL